MLTVKHITLSGEEFVFCTSHVNYVPGTAKNCAPVPPDSVWIYEGSAETPRELCGGTIFVMNERGSTVARYDIGASNVPLHRSGIVGAGEVPANAIVGSALRAA